MSVSDIRTQELTTAAEHRVLLDNIKERLLELTSTDFSWANLQNTSLASRQKAAVLVPIAIHQNEVTVLLTLRAKHLNLNPGDVSFPGGKKDDGDQTEIDTSLRESHEEIGLDRTQVTVIGLLPPVTAVSGILVTPVIGIIPHDFKPVLNLDEVQKCCFIPLPRFLSNTEYDSHIYSYDRTAGIRISHIIHSFWDDWGDGKKVRTWGLTATICVKLAVALGGRAPEFDWVDKVDVTSSGTGDYENKCTVEDPFGDTRYWMLKMKQVVSHL